MITYDKCRARGCQYPGEGPERFRKKRVLLRPRRLLGKSQSWQAYGELAELDSHSSGRQRRRSIPKPGGSLKRRDLAPLTESGNQPRSCSVDTFCVTGDNLSQELTY